MSIAVITVIGASGIISQVVLLRELLVGFCGNELTLGLMLANWLICETAGVFTAGQYLARRRTRPIPGFVALQLLFSFFFIVSIYLSRSFKGLLGFSFGETAGVSAAFLVSLAAFLPPAFCHGALFSAACGILAPREEEAAIGRVYAWETLGTIAGAFLLTYALIPCFNPFEIAFLVAAANTGAILFVPWLRQGSQAGRRKLIYSGVCLALIACLWLLGVPQRLQRHSLAAQWRGVKVLEWRNSVYGNIVVAQRGRQQTLFYNGSPLITVPYPDAVFVQEFGNLPLLFHTSPRDVLLVGAGAGGLLNEILGHPLARVDYAELDPMLIKVLRQYPSQITERELNDPRVRLITQDGRFFVANSSALYDAILLGASRPMELSVNRLFTQEFFLLAKNRLLAGGVFACWLPGSAGYLGRELIELNASVLNALRHAFRYVRVIPGDYNIFIASDSSAVEAVSQEQILQRIKERGISIPLLLPDYLRYRFAQERVEWFRRLTETDESVNRDFHPRAVFASVILWGRQVSPASVILLRAAERLNIAKVLGVVFLCALITGAFCLRSGKRKEISLVYTIATSGFHGMLLNLILIFGYQVAHGYLYHRIGLLVAAFMSGIACGSIFMTRYSPEATGDLRKKLLLFLEIMMSACALATALMLARLSGFGYPAFLFCAGLFLGLEFPLASRLYPHERGVVKRAGILYAADLLGGCAGGIAGALVLVPVLGLAKACVVLAALKVTSALLLWKNL